MADDELPPGMEIPDPMNPKPNQMVMRPDPRQVAAYGGKRPLEVWNFCGQCKFFDLEEGQRRLFKEKRLAEIVHDAGWKAQHLGQDPRELGVCKMRTGTAVGTMSKSCDQFRPKK